MIITVFQDSLEYGSTTIAASDDADVERVLRAHGWDPETADYEISDQS